MKKVLCLMITLIITIGCHPSAVGKKTDRDANQKINTRRNLNERTASLINSDIPKENPEELSVKIITQGKEETYTQEVTTPKLLTRIEYGYLLIPTEYVEEIIPLIRTTMPLSQWKDPFSYIMTPIKLNENDMVIQNITPPLDSYSTTFNFSNMEKPICTISTPNGNSKDYDLKRSNISHTSFSSWQTKDDDIKYINKVLKGKEKKGGGEVIFPPGKDIYSLKSDKDHTLLLFQLLYRVKDSKEQLCINIINAKSINRVNYTVNANS